MDRWRFFDSSDGGPLRSDLAVGLGVTVGAAGILCALVFLDWASRDSAVAGRVTFIEGPTSLLRIAVMTSIALAVLAIPLRWLCLRWLLVLSGLVAVVSSLSVALSSIAAANDIRAPLGRTVTSYEPGAAVGVLSALVVVVAAAVGLLLSFSRRFDRRRMSGIKGSATPQG